MSHEQVDRRSELVFHKIEKMPPPLRQVFSHLIIGISHKIRSEQKLRGDVIGLGSEGLSKLMSQERYKTWSEKDPLLYKAYKALYMLNSVGQSALTYLVYEPICLVELYIEACKLTGEREKPADIRAILRSSMGYGSEQSGQEMLRELVGEEALHLSQQVLELAQREAEATASQEEPEEGTGYFY